MVGTLIGMVIIFISLVAGMYLDFKLEVDLPLVYWGLGIFTGILSMCFRRI